MWVGDMVVGVDCGCVRKARGKNMLFGEGACRVQWAGSASCLVRPYVLYVLYFSR